MYVQDKHWTDLRVGDVFFVIGNARPSPHEWRQVGKSKWFAGLAPEETLRYPDLLLNRAYEKFYKNKGVEPAWMKHLSPRMCRHLRQMWLMGDDFDPLAILPYRQDLGFSFAVEEDGMAHEVSSALNVFRLGRIRQLGYLHDPVVNELAGGDTGMGFLFNHTRYMH